MKDSPWKTVDIVAYVLILIGAINWGLIGLFGFNLVAALFGEMSTLSRIIYTLVGIAGVYGIVALPGLLRRWSPPLSTSQAVREREREQMHV